MNKMKLCDDNIIESLICIFTSTVQEMLCEQIVKFKYSLLPYFLFDFHQTSTVLYENVLLSFELIQIWTEFTFNTKMLIHSKFPTVRLQFLAHAH